MTSLPPPARRPEPLGFDPAKHRVGRPASRPEIAPKIRGAHRDVDLVGETIGDRYRVLGVLGEGGMGTVYEGTHLGLDRPVAIKVLNPAQAKKQVAVKRFQQEARTAGAIGHPNICEIYDMGTLADGRPYLVMEKLVGRTLAEAIAGYERFPFAEIVFVMTQVLSGLVAAHGKGVVHRDIKPENIFLSERPGARTIVKILDFGVSKMIANTGNREEFDLTKTGMVMGTPYYMSPEQARGVRDLDGRVDIYACGVMLYEAICGVRPFRAPNYNSLLLAIVTVDAKPVSEVRPETPAALAKIVARAMTKARDRRYPSALDMLHDLQALKLPRANEKAAKPRATPQWPYDRAPSEPATNVDVRWSPGKVSRKRDVTEVTEETRTQVLRPRESLPPSEPREPLLREPPREPPTREPLREPPTREPPRERSHEPRAREHRRPEAHVPEPLVDDTLVTEPLRRNPIAPKVRETKAAATFPSEETIQTEIDLHLGDGTDARTIPRRRP